MPSKIRVPVLRNASETRRLRLSELQKEFDEEIRESGASLRGRYSRFAQAIDLTPPYYGHIRSRRREVGSALARQIERALGKPVNWLDTPPHKVVVTVQNRERPTTPTQKIIQDMAKRACEVDPFGAYTALQRVIERKSAS